MSNDPHTCVRVLMALCGGAGPCMSGVGSPALSMPPLRRALPERGPQTMAAPLRPDPACPPLQEPATADAPAADAAAAAAATTTGTTATAFGSGTPSAAAAPGASTPGAPRTPAVAAAGSARPGTAAAGTPPQGGAPIAGMWCLLCTVVSHNGLLLCSELCHVVYCDVMFYPVTLRY